MAETSGSRCMAPERVLRAPGSTGMCRINALPDDLLLRAISHLDVRQVVQTCVLSRRWRDLWRSVPRINASHREFDGMADTDEERDSLFKKFVNRFLMLRNSVALDEFRLCYNVPDATPDHDADSADANLWIVHALQCNARTVEVSGWDARLHLDPAVFASECLLTSLELSGVIVFPGFFRNLQTGCRVLERLMLCDCGITDIEITSRTLKFLTIDMDSHITFGEQGCISIPSLIDLRFFADGRIPLLKNMESLVKASVLVRTDDDTQVDDIHQFLNCLSRVTYLDFDYRGNLQKMEKNLQWCPKFNNLMVLTLDTWWLREDLSSFIVFLQNSPNLMKLTLKVYNLGSARAYQALSSIIGELKEISLTNEHLEIVEVVEIAGFEGTSDTNIVEKLLLESGMTSDQIELKHLQGTVSIVLKLRLQVTE
ncbi:hypothetical protein ACP70R_019743 [Stipagrostis hirtigluma subsp. patula]